MHGLLSVDQKITPIVSFYGILFLLSSCSQSRLVPPFTQADVSLVTHHDSLHFIRLRTDSTESQWELPYPVYRFQTGDVDNNGVDDIMVGVIKTTRFDSTKGKRLFIFKNVQGSVRPLWLGSRLGKPLVDFNFVSADSITRIRSIEEERSGNFQVAEYKWHKFGLRFTNYIGRELSITEARSLLSNSP
ncbi:MAG: nuclear receptor-binding factor 2 [Bacteroidota bacterium]